MRRGRLSPGSLLTLTNVHQLDSSQPSVYSHVLFIHPTACVAVNSAKRSWRQYGAFFTNRLCIGKRAALCDSATV